MTDDISLKIGADASDVRTQTDSARTSINRMSVSARTDAQAMSVEFAKMNVTLAAVREQLRGVGSDTSSLRSTVDFVMILGVAKTAWDGLRASVELSADALNKVNEAAQKAGASTRAWAAGLIQSNDTLRDWARSADVYKSGVLQSAAATIALSGNIDRMARSAESYGFENLTRMLQKLTSELTRSGSLTADDASKIVASFGSIGDSSGVLVVALTDILAQLNLTSDAAKEMAGQMVKAFADPQTNGAAFLASLKGVSAETRAQFDAAARTNDVYRMRASLLQAEVEQMQLSVRARIQGASEDEKMYQGLGRVGNLLALGNLEYQKQRAKAEELVETLRKQETELEAIAKIVRGTTADYSEQQTAMERVISSTGNYADRIATVQGKIRTMQAGMSSQAGGGTDRQVQTTRQLVDEENKLKDAQAGGNAVVKDRIASLQKEVDGHKNALEAAQSAIEAQKKIVERTHDENAKAQETLTLLNLQKAAKEQINRLYVLGLEAQKGGADTPAEKHAASMAVVQAKRKGAGDDPIELQQLKNEELAIEREYQNSKDRLAADEVNRKHRDAISDLNIEKQVLQEKQQLDQITKAQMYAGELALEGKRAALERTHLEQLKAIYGEGTEEYRKALLDEEKALRQVKQREEQITRQSNAAIRQDYISVFQSIASSVSGSLMGMIQGTQKFKDLLRNVALDIIKMFIDAGLKMVVNWAATMAQKTVLAVTGESTITAATVAGNAARSASNTAAGVGDIAMKGISVVKSIMASAAETFAGIFGFMSPVMGPAAAAPAAAGMATVAGMASLASFDVGAWNIPNDQLAMVHKNELIMTASQGEAFRNLLQGGGSSGAQSSPSGDTHLHVHATDAASVQALFKNNGRHMAKVLRDVLNANPSLRPSY